MHRKSVFYKFFFSYLMVGMLLILFFGTVLYYFNVVTLDAEVRSKHNTSAAQALGKVDYMLQAMSSIANHFSASELHRALAGGQAGEEQNFISSQLKRYEQNLTEPMRLMLYIRGDTRVFFSDSEAPYETFEEQSGADLTMSRMFSVLNSATRATALHIRQKPNLIAPVSYSAAFVYPIPYMSIIPDMSMVFFLTQEECSAIFDNYFGHMPRNVYLLDQQLQVIYRHESTPYAEGELKRLIGLRGTGVFERSLEGRSDVALRTVSDHSGYSLIITMEEGVFFSRVSVMRTVVWMSIILFVILTLLMAFILTIRNYRPIRLLLRLAGDGEEDFLPQDAVRGKPLKGNELEMLQTHIRRTHDKNRELGLLLDRQRPYILHTCLEALLRGKSSDDIAFQMQCANVSFPYEYFQVMIVAPAGKEALGEKMQGILLACEQVAMEKLRLYVTENIVEKHVSLIVNRQGAAQEGQQASRAIARQIQARLGDIHLEASIGIGTVQNRVEDIHTSYVEAMVVANEYLPNQPGNIMTFEEIPDRDNVEYTFSFTEQSILLQALKQGDKTVALQSLANMIQRIGEGSGSVLITQYQCFDIASTLIRVLNESGGDVRRSDLLSFTDFSSLEEFHEKARGIVEEICKRSETMIEQKSTRLASDLIRYVNEHYRDAGLSLELMAAHFDLSSGYLSRFFKQATGRNFIQYVTLLRMDYVKDRLVNGEEQIKDIIVAAGYIDSASFVRKFKGAEGITPGQYRQRAREKAQP